MSKCGEMCPILVLYYMLYRVRTNIFRIYDAQQNINNATPYMSVLHPAWKYCACINFQEDCKLIQAHTTITSCSFPTVSFFMNFNNFLCPGHFVNLQHWQLQQQQHTVKLLQKYNQTHMHAEEHMYMHTNRCRDQNPYVLLPNKPNEQDQCNEAQCCYIQGSFQACRRFVCTQHM